MSKRKLDEAGVLGILCLAKNEFPDKQNQAVFIKRTTGEVRRMRFDFIEGELNKKVAPAKSFGGKAIIVVRDIKLNQLRSIPIDSLVLLKVNGRTYRVVR